MSSRSNKILTTLITGTLIGGCYGTVVGRTEVDTPDLVYVSPSVQVVSDYDYPVFYSDNVYWRYDSGAWYRSPRRDRGWVPSRDVPRAVLTIDRPESYAHYRAPVRDHRTQVERPRAPAPEAVRVRAPAPEVRVHGAVRVVPTRSVRPAPRGGRDHRHH